MGIIRYRKSYRPIRPPVQAFSGRNVYFTETKLMVGISRGNLLHEILYRNYPWPYKADLEEHETTLPCGTKLVQIGPLTEDGLMLNHLYSHDEKVDKNGSMHFTFWPHISLKRTIGVDGVSWMRTPVLHHNWEHPYHGSNGAMTIAENQVAVWDFPLNERVS